MSKSRKPLARPEINNFTSEKDYYNAYQAYMDSFDTSPVEDFSDLNIEFTANGNPISTPHMSNFSSDIAEILKNKMKDDGLVTDPNTVTVVLHELDETVGAKVHYEGHTEDINIRWTTHEEDYERVLPDGYSVKSFSHDFYDMERFLELEHLAKCMSEKGSQSEVTK